MEKILNENNMRERSELKGAYATKFKDDNQQELKNAIFEAGLSCCSNCDYITDELVRYKDHDFIQNNVFQRECEVLCDDCYKHMYSLGLLKQINEE